MGELSLIFMHRRCKKKKQSSPPKECSKWVMQMKCTATDCQFGLCVCNSSNYWDVWEQSRSSLGAAEGMVEGAAALVGANSCWGQQLLSELHKPSSFTASAQMNVWRVKGWGSFTFLHLGISNEHLPEVFEQARPAEGAVGQGALRHLGDVPQAQHPELGVWDQRLHQISWKEKAAAAHVWQRYCTGQLTWEDSEECSEI